MFFPKSLLFSVPIAILSMEDEDDRQFVADLYQNYKLNMYYTARKTEKNRGIIIVLLTLSEDKATQRVRQLRVCI